MDLFRWVCVWKSFREFVLVGEFKREKFWSVFYYY